MAASASNPTAMTSILAATVLRFSRTDATTFAFPHVASLASFHEPPRATSRRATRLDVANLTLAPKRRCRVLVKRSEEHTSELQSLRHLVCRLLLDKKKKA